MLNYDANDRIASDIYDNNGNTINTGGIGNVYDFENHLVQRGNVFIVYDGDGNRVSETVAGVTTNYVVADFNPTGYAQVLDELPPQQPGRGVVSNRSYTYGLSLISQRLVTNSSQSSFYGYDGHGSVRFLMDKTGVVTDTYDYDAFGNLINQTGTTPNNYLFAGEQFDPALGIYYNRARYYDERQGRFWTQDPDEGTTELPASLHRYLYAAASPTNLVDPSGASWVSKLPKWLQYVIIGTAVHARLYEDFRQKVIVPFTNTSIKVILGLSTPTSLAQSLGLYQRPDLVDLSTPSIGYIYEIKPRNSIQIYLGSLQLAGYILTFAQYDPKPGRAWTWGVAGRYDPIRSFTVLGDVNIEVDPPEAGLVLYRIVDQNNNNNNDDGPGNLVLNPQTIATIATILLVGTIIIATLIGVTGRQFAY